MFMAMIILSDEDGMLKHTDNSLARLICKPVEVVREAIRNLESQDARSNIKAQDGRRIVPLRELMNDEIRGWQVVNKEIYRDRASREDKRKADRERIAEKRKENNDVAGSRNTSHVVVDVAHTDTDANTKRTLPPPSGAFLKFWTAWPRGERKRSQGKCWELWLKKDFELTSAVIMAHVEALKVSDGWKRGFVPAPLVYLNQRQWEGAEPSEPSDADANVSPLYRRKGVM